MDLLTVRQYQILEMISDAFITAETIGEHLNVSIRTVKSEISRINEIIEKADCKIISKSGKGYLLYKGENFDQDLLISFYPEKYDNNIPDSYYERVIYIIKKLLVIDYHIKVEDLADELFISRASMAQIMKDVRQRLTKYRLKLISRPNYGIFVQGDEADKRLAIAEYFFHDNLTDEDYQLETNKMFNNEDAKNEYQKLIQIIKDICDQYKIEMSDYSVHNLAVHIYIAIRRCTFYDYVKVDDSVIAKWQNTIEFKAALKLVDALEKHCNFLLPIGESIYFAQHIRSKRIIEFNHITSKQEADLHKCLNLIMAEINNNFGFNLTQDSEWYRYMVLHIPLMIERLQTHMIIRNPLVKDNMRRYLFATKMTHSACEVISQIYGMDVDINEFGYLLLYFNLAVTRFEVTKPLKIALLSGRGRPEAVMIANEIKERFSSHKYQIYEVDKIDDNYDLIISTYRVKENYDCPYIIISDDNYLEQIYEKLLEIRYKDLDLDTYIKEEYCTFMLDGETKEEVEKNFYQELYKKQLIKEIPDDYNKCLVDELGNGIVHFQDSYRIVRKSMFYICTLKKPVYWDKELVRILILTKTKKENDKDLYNLCRVVSKWANDKVKVNKLLKNPSFDEFKKDLKEKL